MAEIRPISGSTTPASFVLGHELDSIPFRGYHVLIIAVLGRVGFIEGYDLVQRFQNSNMLRLLSQSRTRCGKRRVGDWIGGSKW
jgi:hypothetical protein